MTMEVEDAIGCVHFVLNDEVKESLVRITNHAAKVPGRCAVCRTSRAVWCCLQCYQIGCGRYEKKHALKHAQESNHFVCVNMESPKHLWCYKCDKGIVYFGDSHNNESDSNSSSTSSNSYNNNNKANNNRNGYIALPPNKWKSAQSILKSTPIWHQSMNGGVCGMQNLGNTCFMNASLQALLHCPAVVYLFTLPEISFVKKYNRLPLVDEFVKLTYQIWEGKHRNLIPRDILRCIMYKYPQFRGFGQQDAHEFLTCLLQFLHDEYKYLIPKNTPNIKQKEKEKKQTKYKETSIVYDLFRGEIISSVECCKCNTRSTKVDYITDIQVEIPKQEQMDRAIKERNAKPLPSKGWMQSVFSFVGLQSQSIPLSLCLHSYCTSEDLLNTEKYHCEQCKSKQEAKKTLLIRKLPEILMIQIKRFSHDSFWRGSSKVSTHVSFPIDALDLAQYIHPKHKHDKHNNDTLYDLCSIVKHMGSTAGGHYISFAKHPATAKWYKFDDSRVEPISPEKLSEQQAYILFYTRRKSAADRSLIKSISNTLAVSQQLAAPQKNDSVLLSRYWLHRVQAFSRPGAIDNLWLSCYHGFPLKYNHDRIKYCSIKIPYNTWLELTKKYGLQYNAKMLIHREEEEDKNDDDNDDDNDNNNDIDEKWMKAARKMQHPPWELNHKSFHCEECKLEELSNRREYEKQEIRRLEEDGCPQDCALNIKWANQWRNFVHNKTNIIPQMIDNRHIHSAAGDHTLKEELIKDTDYLMVPGNIWAFLIEIYGGGPKILPTNNKKKKTKQEAASPQNKNRAQHAKNVASNKKKTSSQTSSTQNSPKRQRPQRK